MNFVAVAVFMMFSALAVTRGKSVHMKSHDSVMSHRNYAISV